MLYFTYKTTNTKNGKYYIGCHSSETPDDRYLGSGVLLVKAIEKYGRENFERVILEFYDSRELMWEGERRLIEVCKFDPNCYNLMPGGRGGWEHVNSKGLNLGANNVMVRDSSARQLVLDARKHWKESNPELANRIALENLQKAIQTNTGKKRPNHSEFMTRQLRKQWQENKEKMRDRLSSQFEIISPDGSKFVTNRLQDWCMSHNLPYTTIWKNHLSTKSVVKGKAKGWKCNLIQ